ncbi:MAG TPA: HAMP domain-containing sensor histidine kinase [Candidatus Limnocylindrales bacterium]|nr:HAMP domain-containing sensor histidine kinase [Candidatus Limnocylindrales bacterium]
MPRSLGGRLVAAFALLSIALTIAVGGALFVVLRGLHQDATYNELRAAASSVLPQVRDAIGSGELRGTVLELRDKLAEEDIELVLLGADGRIKALDPADALPVGPVLLDHDAVVGEQFQGSFKGTDPGVSFAYVATAIRKVGASGPRAVAFLTRDRAAGLALADVGRTIPMVILVVLLVAAPLAIALSRSVTRPLRRLAEATTGIPAGGVAPLPLEGPREVRELTGTFNTMSAEVEATRRREHELLVNLRHDLRTPLTVITGFAAALRDGTAKGAAADDAARAIEAEAARLERLVAEVGAIERIRSGEEQIRPELLDAGELVRSTARRFGPRAAAAGVTLDVAIGSDAALTIAADRTALERMLGNLVDNAIRATADGAGTMVRIEVAPALAGPTGVDALRFDVVDDGPGFPAGAANRAYERFWRGDPSRSGAGSGLGLAIVRELALAHGGEVHAANWPSPDGPDVEGAKVGFTLPRVPWRPTEASSHPASVPGPAART